MTAPGKGLLKTVSILFIIFGAILAVISLLAVVGAAALSGMGGAIVPTIGGMLFVATVLILIVSVLELILGIVGLRRSGDPRKAGFFITVGIVLSILSLIPLILSAMSGGFQVTSLISFILPVLYIVGGAMNRKVVVE